MILSWTVQIEIVPEQEMKFSHRHINMGCDLLDPDVESGVFPDKFECPSKQVIRDDGGSRGISDDLHWAG